MQDKDSPYPTVRALSPELIEVDFGPYGEITLEQIKYVHQKHLEFGFSGKQGVLIRADSVIRADTDAQKFSSSPEVCKITSACAITVNSFTALHIGRKFLWTFRPPFPTALFEKRNEAVTWLNYFLVQQPRANHQ